MTDLADATARPAAPESPGVVIGNHHPKYTSTNPAIRWLTRRFLQRLDAVLDQVAARTQEGRVLEVGCGEGEIALRLRRRWPQVTAVDLPDAGLRRRWAGFDDLRFAHADAQRLPFADDAFDVAVAVEALEHLPDPDVGLRELARISRGHLVLSVPREPLFRLGNLAAGRHLRALGNTPGHLNHWSAPGFVRFASQVGAIRAEALPLPWTIVWVTLT